MYWSEKFFHKQVPVYLFDEPTAELDSENRKNVLAVLETLKESAAVVVVSHDEELVKMADKKIVLT